MANKTLNNLVKQLQNGDKSVFDAIYHQTKDAVFYTIYMILNDNSLSEDIMQDTYLTALEKIHTFKKRNYFKAWIITIARNLAINEYNKRKRETLIDQAENEVYLGETYQTAERDILIEQVLNYLDEEERQIVIMHTIGELKHREIATILNKPLGTITWKYNEAIKKLQDKFKESR